MTRRTRGSENGSATTLVIAILLAFAAGLLVAPLLRGDRPETADTPSKHLLLVLSNPVEGREDVYNDWYTKTHLSDIVAVEGFGGARRFRISPAQLTEGGDEPYEYLAIYEVDAADVTVPRDALHEGTQQEAFYVDPAIDRDRTVAWFYSPITPRVAAPD